MPKQGCLVGIKKSLSDQTTKIGMAILGVSLTSLLMLLLHYPLWLQEKQNEIVR
jgi:hypothetical protein